MVKEKTKFQPNQTKGSESNSLSQRGHDIDGNKVKPFDFIATIYNNLEAEPTMEQADANCQSTDFHGYIIDNPIANTWKNLEYALLNTIKRYKFPITLKDDQRNQTIKIFPRGGKVLDVEPKDPIQYYPTFQITYNQVRGVEDVVDYEYFQISAEQRAWIALRLIEKLA
jgi:hypothetical protein